MGKTTCAAATALHYASLGERTLAISTDPTPSLSHIFEARRPQSMTEVSRNLCLDEIGVEKVKTMWDTKFGREVLKFFPLLWMLGMGSLLISSLTCCRA